MMGAVMDTVTILMAMLVPMAFIYLSVCVIKQCVPTTPGHNKMKYFILTPISLIRTPVLYDKRIFFQKSKVLFAL